MNRGDFIKIKIGQMLYNKDGAVVVVSSHWSSDKGEVRDDEYLSCDPVGGHGPVSLRMGDYELWESFRDTNAPDSVRVTVLENRLAQLEEFVHRRLRQ